MTLNEATSDAYAAERGNVMVSEGGVTRKYQWGGTACSGRLLSEANINLLLTAMNNQDRLQIVPSYKTGAGLARCLVGFRLQAIMPLAAR